MVWFAFIVSVLWLLVVVGVILMALKIERDTRRALAPVVAENVVLQGQLRDALAWRQPHVCGLPRADKANADGVYDFGRGRVWQCPDCSLRWVLAGFEAVNTLTRRLDWVTEYESTTGRRPLFDPRAPRAALRAPRPVGPAHRLTKTPRTSQ